MPIQNAHSQPVRLSISSLVQTQCQHAFDKSKGILRNLNKAGNRSDVGMSMYESRQCKEPPLELYYCGSHPSQTLESRANHLRREAENIKSLEASQNTPLTIEQKNEIKQLEVLSHRYSFYAKQAKNGERKSATFLANNCINVTFHQENMTNQPR